MNLGRFLLSRRGSRVRARAGHPTQPKKTSVIAADLLLVLDTTR